VVASAGQHEWFTELPQSCPPAPESRTGRPESGFRRRGFSASAHAIFFRSYSNGRFASIQPDKRESCQSRFALLLLICAGGRPAFSHRRWTPGRDPSKPARWFAGPSRSSLHRRRTRFRRRRTFARVHGRCRLRCTYAIPRVGGLHPGRRDRLYGPKAISNLLKRGSVRLTS